MILFPYYRPQYRLFVSFPRGASDRVLQGNQSQQKNGSSWAQADAPAREAGNKFDNPRRKRKGKLPTFGQKLP